MVVSCLSFVSLYGSFLRRSLCSCGLSSQSVQVDEYTTIHFWGPKPSSHDEKRKSSLLLIHGFGPHGVWQWRQQVSFLSPHFDLYIPDLVFFGESTTRSPERSEIFQAKAIGKLMENVDVNKYSVVGTSYGGFVAYRMAEMWPERVEKVVIASSGVNMKPKDNAELLKRANVEKIEDLMLPETPGQLRTLMRMALSNRVYVPDFFLNDFIDLVMVHWSEGISESKLSAIEKKKQSLFPSKASLLCPLFHRSKVCSIEATRYIHQCMARKQVQRTDEDPMVFEITYRGQHTCNPTTMPSVAPPQSPEKHEIQQNNHQLPLPLPPRSGDMLSNLRENLRVSTSDSDAMIPHLFSFPSASFGSIDNYQQLDFLNELDNNLLQGYSPSFISPATSGSNYFTECGSDFQHHDDSHLSGITTASATNSPLAFPADPQDLSTNFPFNSGFFILGKNDWGVSGINSKLAGRVLFLCVIQEVDADSSLNLEHSEIQPMNQKKKRINISVRKHKRA